MKHYLFVCLTIVLVGTLAWIVSSSPNFVPPDLVPIKTFSAYLAKSAVTTSGTCRAVMQRLLVSMPGGQWPPPCPLSRQLADLFEGPNSSMPITMDWCLANLHEGGEAKKWSESYLNNYRQKVVHDPNESGSYGRREVKQVLDLLQSNKRLIGSSGIVVGTDNPWIEVLAMEAGVREIVTWEYSTIESTHPQVRAKQCKLLAQDFIDDLCPWGQDRCEPSGGRFPLLDFAVSFSSIEHSGLGRYGDGLNPDADLEAVNQVWCMLKPGAILYLGVPMSCESKGWIEFNAHRVYGMQRLAYITRDFEFVGFDHRVGCVPFGHAGDANANLQPIAIFRKPATGVANSRSWLSEMLLAGRPAGSLIK